MQTKEVLVTWHDEPEREFFTYVAIAPGWSYYNKLDDQIFFYFENEQELNDVLVNGTDEFTMRLAD